MDAGTLIFLVIVGIFMFLMHRRGGGMGCCGGGRSHGEKKGKGKDEKTDGDSHC